MNNVIPPKQADHESQKEQQAVLNNTKTELKLSSGKTVKIGFLHSDAQDKLDDVIVEHDEVAKKIEAGTMSMSEGKREMRRFYAKILAAMLIDNYFGIKCFWWLKWRIIHHFWKLNGEDYTMIFAEAKKKATEMQYYMATAYVMSMSDIWTILTKKEAEAFHQEQKSASVQQQ